MPSRSVFTLLTLIVPLLAACAPTVSSALSSSLQTTAARSELTSFSEEGEASWYGPGFAGRLTASGEVFDPAEMTAAHKTLPFGTLVRVTNLHNGRSAIVRINDRGPFKPGRIIDLSREAARSVGMLGSGTARVRVDVLSVQGGVLSAKADESLPRYDVIVSGRQEGDLLLLSSEMGGPVLVRVASTSLEPGEDAQMLLSPELFDRLGPFVVIQSSSADEATQRTAQR